MTESTMERLQRCAAENKRLRAENQRLTARALKYAEAYVERWEDGEYLGKFWRTIDDARKFIAATTGVPDSQRQAVNRAAREQVECD
jgi:hypothetical protein